MKRILIFRNGSEFGGAERHVVYLIEAAKGRAQFGVVTNLPELAEAARPLGAKSWVIPYAPEPFNKKPSLLFTLRFPWDRARLGRVVREFFQGEPGAILCASLSDKLLVTAPAKRAGHRVVWIEHGQMVGRLLKLRPFQAAYRRAATLVDAIICVSQLTADNIASVGVDRAKLHVVYNGTAPVTKERPTRTDGEPVRLIATNRLAELKGYPELFDACAALERPWRLDVVGDGPLRAELEDQVRSLGLADRVTFHGFQTNVTDRLIAADIFVNPTCHPGEGLPFVNIEALAAGTPVVTSRSGGCVETIEDGVSGRFVDPTDTAAFTRVLDELARDPKRRKQLSTGGRERWRTHFSLDAMANRTLELLGA